MYNQTDISSPWLDAIGRPTPHPTSSFVEFLRWSRQYDSTDKTLNSAKLLELLKAVEDGDYSARLQQLTDRTKRLATYSFSVQCPWRIRVGGTTGPESRLLPAFDALGMPYIPSSTLKGVARAVAEQEADAESDLETATLKQQEIIDIFGAISPNVTVGIVTFLDAYPIPGRNNRGGLSSDMANAIWGWESQAGVELPSYQANPNIFLSLDKPTFVIGLRSGSAACSTDILDKVKRWLLQGMIQGIGSRKNSGYGKLVLPLAEVRNLPKEQRPKFPPFLRVPFELEGQGIHGYQSVEDPRNWHYEEEKKRWKIRFSPISEVRPVAFRCMLRYWFRAFTLGVLSPQKVRKTEALIFGSIQPEPINGLLRLEVARSNSDETNQSGELLLRLSPITSYDSEAKTQAKKLLRSLTWLMFHLGSVGQGARRPHYERAGNPSHRGSDLSAQRNEIMPEAFQKDWQLPPTPAEFQQQFQTHLKLFYQALGQLINQQIDYHLNVLPPAILEPTSHQWVEAVDRHCEILVLRKASKEIKSETKPYPLKVLADEFHRLEDQNYSLAKSLCGGVRKESIRKGDDLDRDVTPSPVWIANLQKYQVITVFGATQNPRQAYLQRLKDEISQSNIAFDSYAQLWPIQS